MAKTKKTNKSNHYVDNEKFLAAMIEYTDQYKEAKKNNTELPRPSNYIGECLYLIASRLSTNRNFIGYTFREEMVSDAVENCLRYLYNFDPNKTKNPFAYFTQISWYAFLRRMDSEKKEAYVKYKSIENSIINNTLVDMSSEDQKHFQAASDMIDNSNLQSLIEKYEKKPKKKKPKKKSKEATTSTVDKFTEEVKK